MLDVRVLFCVFHEKRRGTNTRSTILPKSARFSAVRGNHQGHYWWPWESSSVCDLSFCQFTIVFVRFKWHDFCIGHATPVIYVMRISAKQLIRFLFEISDLRTYKMHIIAAYYCVLPKHLFAQFLTVTDFKATIRKIKIFQCIQVHFYMWNGM